MNCLGYRIITYVRQVSNQVFSVNPLTPNDHYSGRSALLTSKSFILFIQQIYVLNILNMVQTLRFLSLKCNFCHNPNVFGSCIIHIFIYRVC